MEMLTQTQVKKVQKTIEAQDSRLPLVFNALGDVGRFRIFKLFMKRKDICVSDVANILSISLPAASQQLRVLELSGLVKKQRMGQMICYEIKAADPLVKSLIKVFNDN